MIPRDPGLAATHGVAVGAHPGYADREHFGRRELRSRPTGSLGTLCVYQIGGLLGDGLGAGT